MLVLLMESLFLFDLCDLKTLVLLKMCVCVVDVCGLKQTGFIEDRCLVMYAT